MSSTILERLYIPKVQTEDVCCAILQYNSDRVSRRKQRKMAYRWPRQTKTVWFIIAWIHRWFFKETNMVGSVIVYKRMEITDKFYLELTLTPVRDTALETSSSKISFPRLSGRVCLKCFGSMILRICHHIPFQLNYPL